MDRINANDLKSKMDTNDIALFDVRGDDEYEAEHIPGAKTAPLTGLRERVDGLVQRDTPVAVYGGGDGAGLSQKAATLLDEMGYQNVYQFQDGLKGWKDAGFQTEAYREQLP